MRHCLKPVENNMRTKRNHATPPSKPYEKHTKTKRTRNHTNGKSNANLTHTIRKQVESHTKNTRNDLKAWCWGMQTLMKQMAGNANNRPIDRHPTGTRRGTGYRKGRDLAARFGQVSCEFRNAQKQLSHQETSEGKNPIAM